jgi:hypothetical protein
MPKCAPSEAWASFQGSLDELRDSRPLQWGVYAGLGDRLVTHKDAVRLPLSELVLQAQERPRHGVRLLGLLALFTCMLCHFVANLIPPRIPPRGALAIAINASYFWTTVCKLKPQQFPPRPQHFVSL